MAELKPPKSKGYNGNADRVRAMATFVSLVLLKQLQTFKDANVCPINAKCE